MGLQQRPEPAEAGRRGCKHRRTLSALSGRPPTVKLDQFLKWQGLVGTGGEAKQRIQRGDVTVNGAIETRRGRQLAPGDAVAIDGREVLMLSPRLARGGDGAPAP